MLHGSFHIDHNIVTNIEDIPVIDNWCGAMLVKFFEDGIERFDWTVFEDSLNNKVTPYCYCISKTNESETPITLMEYLSKNKSHPFLEDFTVEDMNKTSLWEYYKC